MAKKKSAKSGKRTPNLERLLIETAGRLVNYASIKQGTIAVRATGAGGGDFFIECDERGVRLARSAPSRAALIEIMGDARQIEGVLTGKKNARTQFLAGGFRVRGDLRYFSNLALELGILESPL